MFMVISLNGLLAPTENPIINPHAEDVESELIKLCNELGIWQPHIGEYNTMSAYLFPYADKKRLFSIGLFNNLLYFVDDMFDRHKVDQPGNMSLLIPIFHDAANTLLNGSAPAISHPITDAVAEIYTWFKPLVPDSNWLRRFSTHTIEHLSSSLEDVDNDIPGGDAFNQYNSIRDKDSGMSPTIDLIEFALGFTISPTIRQNNIITHAQLQVARYCSLTNDLFSYDKEVTKYGSEFNAVVMLQKDGYSLEEAISYLISELNQMVEIFKGIYTKIRSEELSIQMRDKALFYMDCLWYQIIAAYHWQFSTNRYRSQDSLFFELQSPVFVSSE